MSIVHEPVEDAVGDRGIAYLRVPGGDRQLAGQQGGMHLITPIADLQKIPALCLGQRSHRPIIDDQQIEPAEPVSIMMGTRICGDDPGSVPSKPARLTPMMVSGYPSTSSFLPMTSLLPPKRFSQ